MALGIRGDVFALAIVWLALPGVGAANVTWNVAGSGQWNTSNANWTGDSTTYANGDAVLFNNSAGGTTLSQGTLRLGNSNAVGGGTGLVTIYDGNTGSQNTVLEIAANPANPLTVANFGTGTTTIA